jgi:hypothetical protein
MQTGQWTVVREWFVVSGWRRGEGVLACICRVCAERGELCAKRHLLFQERMFLRIVGWIMPALRDGVAWRGRIPRVPPGAEFVRSLWERNARAICGERVQGFWGLNSFASSGSAMREQYVVSRLQGFWGAEFVRSVWERNARAICGERVARILGLNSFVPSGSGCCATKVICRRMAGGE